MPKLNDFRSTKSIILPSFPDSEVVIYDSLLLGDVMDDTNRAVKDDITMWMRFIKSWNLVGDDDQPLVINIDNLKLLPVADFNFVVSEVNKFSSDVKKK